MKIIEAITQIDEMKPNQYDEKQKIRWLSELDGKVFNEIILTHRHACDIAFEQYGADDIQTLERVLLVPSPYTGIYIEYLAAQIDYRNGEMDRYRNSMIMFNSAYEEFAAWYTRTHMPLQRNHFRF